MYCFTAFTSVTFPAQTIHRDGERFMGFGRDRSKTHRTGAETFYDFFGRFDVLQRN